MLLTSAFALILLSLTGRVYWNEAVQSIPQPLALTVVFPPGVDGVVEPIVAVGRFGAADFLSVRYTSPTTGVLVYDSWGSGGPASREFPLHSGVPQMLELALPTLSRGRGASDAQKRIRARLNGTVLLEGPVASHGPHDGSVYFAANPIGGTPAAEFRGTVTLNHEQLRGPYSVGFKSALALLFQQFSLFLAVSLVICVLVAYAFALLVVRVATTPWRNTVAHMLRAESARTHRTFLALCVLAAVLFAACLTGGTFQLTYPDSFGAFYDHQARSLLLGRLDVPPQALGNEAFVFEGKHYGYFGPTPALLRIPFLLIGIGFGELSRWSMLICFVASLTGGYALLRLAALAIGKSIPTPGSAALLVGASTASTLLFLASRAYVYHEAILCGAALATWSVFAALRYLREERSRWWIGALAGGVLAVHARPPTGLFALAVLGTVALIHLIAAVREAQGWARARRALLVGLAAVAGVLTFNALSYLKFRSTDGAPLRYHVQYDLERLARFDGRNFHFSNVRQNADTYFLAPHFVVRRDFPWIYIGGEPRVYPEAKMDMREPTLALPFAMPGLVFLAVAGAAMAAWREPSSRLPLAAIAGGAAPMTMALLAAVASSHRYTADFWPALVGLAAWGLAATEGTRLRGHRVFRATGALLVVVGLPITLAFTLHYQSARVWGTPPEVQQRYERLRKKVDGWFARPQGNEHAHSTVDA